MTSDEMGYYRDGSSPCGPGCGATWISWPTPP